MVQSVGEGIAQGLQAGFGMVQQQQAAQRAQQQQEFQQNLQTQQANLQQQQFEAQQQQRQQQTDRQQQQDALASLNAQQADLVQQMGGLYKKYGGDPTKIPQAELQPFIDQRDQLRQARQAVLQKNYQPFVDQFKQQAQDTLTGLQTGRISFDDLKPGQLAKAVAAVSGRNPMDFVGQDGNPSLVAQAGQKVQDGLQTGNHGMLLEGANTLLAPELNVGVGGAAPDGNEITGKKLVGLFPDPNHPDFVHPVLDVSVKRPDGATANYHAPVTQNRSSDPNDQPIALSMPGMMDQLNRQMTTAQFLSTPEMADHIKKDMKASGDDIDNFLSVYSSLGGQMPQKKVTYSQINQGNQITQIGHDEQGNVVSSQTFPVGAQPRIFAPSSSNIQDRMDAIDELDIPEDQKTALKAQALAGGRGGRGGIGGGGAPIPNSVTAGVIADTDKMNMAQLGLKPGAARGSMVQANGAPATPDQIAQFNANRTGYVTKIRDAAAGGKLMGPTEALQGQPPAPAPSQFQVGQLYPGKNGTQAKYGGKDAQGKDIWLRP